MAMSEATRALVKEIAREIIKEYEEQNEKKINGAIRLHAADCEVKKYHGWKTLASGTIGGIIVVAARWVFDKIKI